VFLFFVLGGGFGGGGVFLVGVVGGCFVGGVGWGGFFVFCSLGFCFWGVWGGVFWWGREGAFGGFVRGGRGVFRGVNFFVGVFLVFLFGGGGLGGGVFGLIAHAGEGESLMNHVETD